MNSAVQLPRLIDTYGRQINYLRLSVTDRCDFRCIYCMNEDLRFLPRKEILSLEELGRIAQAFTELGVEKIRLTGGEPLVRRDLLDLVSFIGTLGLKDFAMTTNGSQLSRYAAELKAAGLKRLNLSLDSLDPEKFRRITRKGDLAQVLDGLDAALDAGFQNTKINSVILQGRNDDEVLPLVELARRKHLDISFIEEMPLGELEDHHRAETFCSSDQVRQIITQRYALHPCDRQTAGPSRYYRLADSDSRIGFISPHSHNFCGDCNRVRVTVEGSLLLCLGNEQSIDLRPYLREHPHSNEPLKAAIMQAMQLKPERHYFSSAGEVQLVRFMNMTGG